jgi:hypothetical protein
MTDAGARFRGQEVSRYSNRLADLLIRRSNIGDRWSARAGLPYRSAGSGFCLGLQRRLSGLSVPGDPLAEPLDPDGVPAKTAGPAFDLAAVATNAWRRAEIPAANGHSNARSVAGPS